MRINQKLWEIKDLKKKTKKQKNPNKHKTKPLEVLMQIEMLKKCHWGGRSKP